MTAFTQGLYYPWIDVKDPAWLKTACVYWDSLRTIVPESIDNPYRSSVAQELEGEGFLVPFRVESGMEEVEALTGDVLDYLDTQEGLAAMFPQSDESAVRIHHGKLPYMLDRLRRDIEMHPGKLPVRVGEALTETFFVEGRDWWNVDARFADFYMTLLARRIADRIHAGLVTPLGESEQLAIAARVHATSPARRRRRRRREYDGAMPRRAMPGTLAQGALAHLALSRIGIHPETPVAKLLEFRRAHTDELARFRSAVGKLAGATEGADGTVESIQQKARDLYKNEVAPAMADLRAALKGGAVRAISQGTLKLTFLSTSAGLILGGLSGPVALLAGAGVSLAVAGVHYHEDRKETLRNSPYSYLLKLGDEFGSTGGGIPQLPLPIED